MVERICRAPAHFGRRRSASRTHVVHGGLYVKFSLSSNEKHPKKAASYYQRKLESPIVHCRSLIQALGARRRRRSGELSSQQRECQW
jgi:hypothetical protein